ncbi:Ras-related protein Rab-21 [Portunus trituberculatus]|uniref:Ras-related protein Rab-21 n=1 Tax=Portunus trituberculatus TaxID=210409 RepID=A0A5B7GPR4_PORTR|nr:Ras-related protein Rab-21 [Portunus trituberculatus]
MLGDDICLIIAGNKTDLERERHVSLEEAETKGIVQGQENYGTKRPSEILVPQQSEKN